MGFWVEDSEVEGFLRLRGYREGTRIGGLGFRV